eukprot:GILJ01001747.1.p1 GENE.GILJ01001747.1~~GILJ01001747.1.p1  ORF type:complete len:204 (-),score=35.48 GILJ01001747.1:208-780(-)
MLVARLGRLLRHEHPILSAAQASSVMQARWTHRTLDVILIKDIQDRGLAGDVLSVAPGFGRNYLVNNKLAVYATPINREKYKKTMPEEEQEKILALWKRLREAKKLKKMQVTVKRDLITVKDKETIKPITQREVAAAIQSKHKIRVPPTNILLPEMQALGTYEVMLFHPDPVKEEEMEMYKLTLHVKARE